MTSVRRHLLYALILAVTVGSLLTAAFIYGAARHEINELYNKNMQEIAATLQSQVSGMLDGETPLPLAYGAAENLRIKREEEFLIQVWRPDGTPVYMSHRALPLALQPTEGWSETYYTDDTWRVYQTRSKSGIVQVSQPFRARKKFVREMAVNMLYPVLSQIPIIGLFIWLAVGRSLAPLNVIARGIQRRSARSLDPLPENVPAEIRTLVQELNALLERLRNSLGAQQRFTADAAHELRTPLAAIKLQIGLLERAPDAPARSEAIQKLHRGVDRVAHMAQQLLTLARLEPDYVQRARTQVQLMPVALAMIEQHIDMAHAKHIDLGTSRMENIQITGDEESLRILLNNLLDNAVRYTQPDGRIDLALYSDGDDAVIEVKDNGIGIPENDREKVFERFHRAVGTETYGTGLGLSIAKHIVQQSAGTIAVAEGLDGKGAGFTVRLPLQPTA